MGPSLPGNSGSEGTRDSSVSPYDHLINPSLVILPRVSVENLSEDDETLHKTDDGNEDAERFDDDEYVVVDDQCSHGKDGFSELQW